MGATASFLEAEKLTWIEHTLRYDATSRAANLVLLKEFKDGTDLSIAYVENSMANVAYQHWFVTDKKWFIEFGAAGLDVYTARVNINNQPRQTYNIQKTVKCNPDIRLRMSHVLGMKNYSLCLRNCEHVANYIFTGKWVSHQMLPEGKLLAWFVKHMMDNRKRLVNTAPDTIRPHLFDAKVAESKAVYPFLNTKYQCTNFEYFLDAEEDTYRILVLGPTGAGKSRLINVIFNQPICTSEASLQSVTREIYFVRGQGEIMSRKREIVLADTIGLADTDWDEKYVTNLIKDRVSANIKQVDAVYIVLSSARLVPELKKSIQEMLKWLNYSKGNNRYSFRFIITHCEGLTAAEKTKLIAQAKELLGLGDTVVALYDHNGKPFAQMETVVCVGFPPAHTLNDAGKAEIAESWNAASHLLYFPSRYGSLSIQNSFCNIL